MKYIDAEKLLSEIESRMEDCKLPNGTFPTTTNIVRYEELSCLHNFITSLQQEQPEVDIDDEIDKVIADYSFTKTIDSGGLKTIVLDYEKIAHHFAEWGEKNAYKAIMKKADEVRDKRFDIDYEVKIDPAAGFDLGCINIYREGKLVGQYVEPKEEKKLPEDLVEAAKKYDEAESWRWEAPKYPRREAFEAGAEWQKRQMMKDAVEGEVVKDISNKLAVTAKGIDLDGFKFGDKVRVVIVKEEEK